MVTPDEDTWTRHNKQHDWKWTGRAATGQDDDRILIKCRRCAQTRLISRLVGGKLVTKTDPGISTAWGCPRVPLWFLLECWLWRSPLPEWDAADRPPWLVEFNRS